MRENTIYATTQYNNFIFKNGNRKIDEKHVREIAERMESVGWVGAPIEISVNEKGQFVIEEGQHRYEAAKETKIPVKFIKVNKRSTYETAVQNSMVSRWTQEDFVEAYASDGYTSYKYIKNLMREFPDVKLSYILMILSKGNGGKKVSDDFKKGYIKVDADGFAKARKNLEGLRLIKNELDKVDTSTSAYLKVSAILLRKGLIDAERMAEKIGKYGVSLIVPTTSSKYSADILERLYNYRSKSDVVYFMDAYKKEMR